MIYRKKNRGHRTSKIVKSRQSSSNGHLSVLSFVYFMMDYKTTGLVTWWRDRRNLVEICDVTKNAICSVGHNSSLWSQCKSNCPQVLAFILTKADASIGIKDVCLLVFLKIYNRNCKNRIFQVFKYWCFVIAFFWFSFSQNDMECWETGRAMYMTLTEGACLSKADLSTFLFDIILYLLNTFSWNSREWHPEAQMSSNSVSMHL